jgi:hypothetical protein
MQARAKSVSVLVALTLILLACNRQETFNGTLSVLGNPITTTGTFGPFQLVGEVSVSDSEPELIGDVAGHPGKSYAYLARWGGSQCEGPEKRGQQLPDGGAYVIDISNPAQPRQVGFIPAHQDTLVGEGLQVVNITTPKFSGDILVMNHEGCGKNYKAGFSLWNVTNPLKPVKLALQEGDFTTDGGHNNPHDANQTHSAFAWDAGAKAYLVATDDDEVTDVDIFDITNPKQPKLLVELNLNQFDIGQLNLGSFQGTFLHDMVVKQIAGRFIMLLSYWDGGYVKLDVTDPANPVFLDDTQYANVDPQLLAATGVALLPEGNGHQAEFTADNAFIIATDEDFTTARVVAAFGGQNYQAGVADFGPSILDTPLSGQVVWTGGFGCTPAELPAAPTSDSIALIERGVCFFQEKAAAAFARGYAGYIVANDVARGDALITMSPLDGGPYPPIPGAFVGFSAGEAMKGAVGATNGAVTVSAVFDGWGYVQLFDANTLTNLDTFVVPEAMDPAFATGFGDLSVHEVATDPTDPDIGYLSYYAAGMRVVQIQCSPACQLVEVGGYTNPNASFWGVEVWTQPTTGQEYVLGSDRNSGLKIFKYTGP